MFLYRPKIACFRLSGCQDAFSTAKTAMTTLQKVQRSSFVFKNDSTVLLNLSAAFKQLLYFFFSIFFAIMNLHDLKGRAVAPTLQKAQNSKPPNHARHL